METGGEGVSGEKEGGRGAGRGGDVGNEDVRKEEEKLGPTMCGGYEASRPI